MKKVVFSIHTFFHFCFTLGTCDTFYDLRINNNSRATKNNNFRLHTQTIHFHPFQIVPTNYGSLKCKIQFFSSVFKSGSRKKCRKKRDRNDFFCSKVVFLLVIPPTPSFPKQYFFRRPSFHGNDRVFPYDKKRNVVLKVRVHSIKNTVSKKTQWNILVIISIFGKFFIEQSLKVIHFLC